MITALYMVINLTLNDNFLRFMCADLPFRFSWNKQQLVPFAEVHINVNCVLST